MDLSRAVEKIVAPLKRRIHNMIARGVLTAIQDSGGLQIVQATLFDGELQDEIERFQQYGFTSVPPPGSEVVVVFPQGDRSHPIVLAADHRGLRLKDMEAGDSAIYTGENHYIRLKAEDGKIYISAPHNIIVKSEETLRLEGKRIEIHATEKVKWDVLGRGYDYLPDRTDSFEQGSQAGATAPISPPEHGDPPAE